MKRYRPWIAFASYCLLGGGLLLQMAMEKPVHIIQQNSIYAVIDVSDSDLASAIANGVVRIESKYPGGRTLIRDTSGNPTRLDGKPSPSGNILVINPAGIIVGSGGENSASFGETAVYATLERDTILVGKSIPEGNVYALALKEGGSIRPRNRSVEVKIAPETRRG